jgi:N-acetylmuramic acid 6-phosphate etherase
MDELPQTETINPKSVGLDVLATPQLVELLTREQRAAAEAVAECAPALARAVDAIATRLRSGGRLHYVGAGTSGRIGVLDASEMPPTFGVERDIVCAHIAGGDAALLAAIEGAEDDGDAGEREIAGHVSAGDAVVGISASGGAAYVVRAIQRARSIGAYTAAIVNSPGSALAAAAEEAIVLRTGAEPLTGSTRMKAGTAQKIALNTISTAVMVRLGKVYDNLMVDVVATNKKLRSRALRLVRSLTELDEPDATAALTAAGGSVKIAVVMAKRGVDAEEARRLLAQHGGALRALL